MRFFTCFLALIISLPIHAQSNSSALFRASPDAPPVFLDDERLRVFAASDLSQADIDAALQITNDAYELWMGSPYYGKSQAKAIYLMITGNELEASKVANREYCDHLVDTGFQSAAWCNPDTYIDYVNNGGAGINSAGPVEGYYFMVMAAGNDPVGSDGYKSMTYHEIFHIYQMSNVYTDSYEELDSVEGRMSGDNPDELVAWWMEGGADFFTALYGSENADRFKDEMRWALEGYGPFSMPRKEKFFAEGVKLRNISWEMEPLTDLGYRIGSWFTAYLVSRHGEEAIYNHWETVDELGFEATFEKQFGRDYRSYLDEFEVWLEQPNEDLFPILDGLYENKIKAIADTGPPSKNLRIALEEPVEGEIHTGVGNLRGWAVGDAGIEKVEIWIDDVYAFDVPYGGSRGDVGNVFPDIAGSSESGFSMAYAYSGLTAGEHTAKAVAYDADGSVTESAISFSVVKFEESFITDPNAVDLNNASCSVSGDEVSVVDAVVSGDPVDMLLKWRTAEQGFEIIEIHGSGAGVVMLQQQQSVLAGGAVANADESGPTLRVTLEEPVNAEIHGGVGNLRGWAVASQGIEKIEIYIDGDYAFDAPYGGARGDVGAAFPDVANSTESGFSLAFAYSNLTSGAHTIEAVARTADGQEARSAATFEVVKFAQDFISDPQAVNLDAADCVTAGDEISITGAVVSEKTYDMILDWRTAEQGFEIIDIR